MVKNLVLCIHGKSERGNITMLMCIHDLILTLKN